MIAPLFIAVVAFVIVAYFLNEVLADLKLYAEQASFPCPNLLFFGTLISFLAVAYYWNVQLRACSCSSALLWLPLFYVFYIFFTTNLTLRAEYFVNGARTPITVGAFWLALCFLVVGGVTLQHPGDKSVFYLYVVLVWLAYLTYYWSYA